MYDSPYRPCPVCRTAMKPKAEMPIQVEGSVTWYVYDCPNSKSEVWIAPFKGIANDKTKRKSFWKR